MTWQWTRTASAAALFVLSSGCFSEVGPNTGADDDDGGTTSGDATGGGASGDPSIDPSVDASTPTLSSDSSGDIDDTTGSTTPEGDSSDSSGSTTSPPDSARIDFFPRACELVTNWESHLGEVECDGVGRPTGEVIELETKGEFERVISVRPPPPLPTENTMRMEGHFTELSLAGFAAPVLRGQAACSDEEKCEVSLIIRIAVADGGFEEIHTGSFAGGEEPFEIAIPLTQFAGQEVEVTLIADSILPLDPTAGPTATLWADVHIAGT